VRGELARRIARSGLAAVLAAACTRQGGEATTAMGSASESGGATSSSSEATGGDASTAGSLTGSSTAGAASRGTTGTTSGRTSAATTTIEGTSTGDSATGDGATGSGTTAGSPRGTTSDTHSDTSDEPGTGRVELCPPGSATLRLDLKGKVADPIAGIPIDPNAGHNLEGPVWLDGSLFLSHIRFAGGIDPAQILKYTPGQGTELWLADAGTNGLVIDPKGRLVGAQQKTGAIVVFDKYDPKAAPVPLVETYLGARFNSPNDLTFRSDGHLYFTDPAWQAASVPPQAEKRAYHVTPAGRVSPIMGHPADPNGITISADETALFITGTNGLTRHAVASDGTVGMGKRVDGVADGDGMVVDCAGNLYVTSNSSVLVLDPTLTPYPDRIAAPGATNVAFGGPNRTTLFITSLSEPEVVRSVELNVPGFPY